MRASRSNRLRVCSPRSRWHWSNPLALAIAAIALGACEGAPAGPGSEGPGPIDPELAAEGREIFRFDDFGDSGFWTDTLRLHELVEQVDPETALQLGLKVDSDAIPPEVLEAVLADPASLSDPAVTRALLSLDAVVGLRAHVEGDRITRIGITCALCHSTVDDAVAPGIGRRMDGWANRDLAVGTIVSLTPGLPEELRAIYASWPAGFFDPRFNVDGISDPVVIPPAYGLDGVELETYTGDGPVSYWNNYVAVVEMHGRGSFTDPRIGIDIRVPEDEDQVKDKLLPLFHYQRSLAAPAPPAGSFLAEAAAAGKELFEGDAQCSACHYGVNLTGEGELHAPAATGMDPGYARRSATRRYRATPLRGLWQHGPYFHDGSARTLAEVVEHYDAHFNLGLSPQERAVLVEYLKSL